MGDKTSVTELLPLASVSLRLMVNFTLYGEYKTTKEKRALFCDQQTNGNKIEVKKKTKAGFFFFFFFFILT